MEKGSVSSAVIKSVILIALGALIVLGVYMLFTRNRKSPTEESYNPTVVDELTTTNLDKNYPASARKVVELYIHTMQVMYKEEYNEDQEAKMIELLRGIMDDELLSINRNFDNDIRDEVKRKKSEDNSISNFEILQKREPEEYKKDGRWMCKIDCIYYMRMGTTGTTTVDYVFLLRRDEATKNWKIYGWTLKEKE
jgi:hypothetical protein